MTDLITDFEPFTDPFCTIPLGIGLNFLAFRHVEIGATKTGEASTVTLTSARDDRDDLLIFVGTQTDARHFTARVITAARHLTSNMPDLIDGGRETSVRPSIRRSSP